jgi:hypothetical protein
MYKVARISSGKRRFSFPGKDSEDIGSILGIEEMDQRCIKEARLVGQHDVFSCCSFYFV